MKNDSLTTFFDVLKKYRLEIVFITPLFAFLFGFTLIPILSAVQLSFIDQATQVFTFKNYEFIFNHFRFVDAFFNTVFISTVSLSLELLAGLILALALSRKFKGRGIFRAIFLVPLGVSTVVSGVQFRLIFRTTGGYANELFYRLGFIDENIVWIGTESFPENIQTLMTVIVADMWKVTPLVMLILLAGIESIPEDLYEAAQVDGAGVWKRFRDITLPLLMPFVTMAIVIRGVDAFRIFALPLFLAGQHVPVLGTFAYDQYTAGNFGYSAASSMILMVMILIVILTYVRLTGAREAVGR